MDAARKLMLLAADIEPEADPILWDVLREGTERRWGVTRDVGKTLSEALLEIVVQLEDEQENAGREAMPEGVEWPRYEDGEPVRFGDDVSRHGEDFEANVIALYRDGSFSLNFWAYSKGERCKRPAVLAADGEPLEVGQTVWDVESWEELKVEELCDVGLVQLLTRDGVSRYVYPDQLTHQRPVLDADGVPIREGDTVWPKYPYEEPDRQVESAEVVYVHRAGRIDIQAKYAMGMSFRQQVDAEQLTHTKPEIDTWERIEEDARGLDSGVDRELFTHTHEDIVRRCRALAERERGE